MAVTGFEKGELILAERPLVCIPVRGTPESRAASGSLSCAHCFAFVGSTELHMHLAAGHIAPQDAMDAAAALSVRRRGFSRAGAHPRPTRAFHRPPSVPCEARVPGASPVRAGMKKSKA